MVQPAMSQIPDLSGAGIAPPVMESIIAQVIQQVMQRSQAAQLQTQST